MSSGPLDPWFSRHRGWATVVAAVLYAAIFMLRLLVHGADNPISLLFVLPIALLATAYGRRAGGAAGASALALVLVWTAIHGVTLTPLGWITRATPLLLLGVLVGDASDRIRHAGCIERELLRTRVCQRAAADMNDSIIQHLAAAKWSAESGRHEEAIQLLTSSIERAESLLHDLLLQGTQPSTSPDKPNAA